MGDPCIRRGFGRTPISLFRANSLLNRPIDSFPLYLGNIAFALEENVIDLTY